MVDQDQSVEDSAETLYIKARKGATAEGAQQYMGDYLWARLWRAVTSIANCPPDVNVLLQLRAEVHVCIKIAQDLQLDIANAEIALSKIKKIFTTKINLGKE